VGQSMKNYNDIKSRVLSENFGIDNFDKLFEFLRLNSNFSFTIRNERVIIYYCGRKALEIIPHRNYYTFAFNFNTATETLLVEPNYVDETIDMLINDLNFSKELRAKYINWKEQKLIYSQFDRKLKSNYRDNYLQSIDFNIDGKLARISKESVRSFDYETYFNRIKRLCQDCAEKRPEEAVKQTFINRYSNINNEYCIFDSEFEPSFCNDNAKREFEKRFGKFVHPDLIALKRDGSKVKVIFIELKCLIKSMIGKKADIIGHINDAIAYKNLYESEKDKYQRQSLEGYVRYTLNLKISKGLLNGSKENLGTLLDSIDFDKAPELVILCAIKNNEPQITDKYQLAEYLKKSNGLTQLHNYIKENGNINYEFICGNEDTDTLIHPRFKTCLNELIGLIEL
jgi:hypothetical protein